MLGRLSELREAAGLKATLQKPGALEEQAVVDTEWQYIIDEMSELFKEILEDETACIRACQEVQDVVDKMEKILELQGSALLPSKLAQLSSRMESQEIVCQRMIRRAKEALSYLKAEDQDDVDDAAVNALQPVRSSIAKARAIEFKNLVQAFFAARTRHREEISTRARRQLRFAYPDASEDDLNEIMEFPELAISAISRRIEKGSEASLDGILGEIDGKRADVKKLEQGAQEIKLLFLQFEELIDVQGENLDSVEANIKSTLGDTADALGVLQDLESEKRAYERKKLKFKVWVGIICFLIFFNWFIRPVLAKQMEKGDWSVVGAIGSAFHTLGECLLFLPRKAAAAYAKGGSSFAELTELPRMSSLAELTDLQPASPQQFYGQDFQQEEKRISEPTPLGFIARRDASFHNPLLRHAAFFAREERSRHTHLRKVGGRSQQGSITPP